MGIRDFSNRLFGNIAADPVSWLEFDGDGINFNFEDSSRTQLLWSDLKEIALQAVAGGVAHEKIHYLFRTEKAEVRVARSTPGFDDLDIRLTQLSGFDHVAFKNTMIYNDDIPVVLWQSTDRC